MTKKKPNAKRGSPLKCKKCHALKNPKCKCGRPTVFTKEVLRKLTDAFQQTFTVEDACKFARITPSSYYLECKRNPVFSEEMELAQLWPEMIARSNIVKTAAYDASIAIKYLERKRKAEWSTRVETQNTTTVHLKPLSERAIELLKKYNGGKAPVYTRATQKNTRPGEDDEGQEE